jgi:hypothetical protein
MHRACAWRPVRTRRPDQPRCKWGFDPLGSQNGVGKGVGIVGSIREKRFASAFWLAPQ